jgi:hypothetical protein
MSFFLIGVVLLGVAIYFLRDSLKNQNKEGIIGMSAIILAALILIVFFGVFYNYLIK